MMLYMSFIDDDDDRHLFNRIYEAYRKQMFLIARSLLDSDADAEDAVHDVFLRIVKNRIDLIRKIGNENDLRNYLLTSAKNAALNRIRQRKNELILSEEELELNLSGQQELSDDEFVEKLCDHIDYNRIVKAIASLDSKCREAMYYHFVLEFTSAEVAKLLNCTNDAVIKRLARGKKLVLKMLSSGGNDYEQ